VFPLRRLNQWTCAASCTSACLATPLLACCTKGSALFRLDVDDEDGLLDQRGHIVYLFVGEDQAVVEAPVAQCPGLIEVANDVARPCWSGLRSFP
jgi:hypothetical protein